MKRKVLSVLFATVLTAGMLAGCGSTENSSDKSSDQKEEKSDEDTSEGQKGLEDAPGSDVASEEDAKKLDLQIQYRTTVKTVRTFPAISLMVPRMQPWQEPL